MLIEGASVNLHRLNPSKSARVATTSDRRRFFGSFIHAAKNGRPFNCNLTAQTDPRGVIVFDYRGKQIPYPVAYDANRQVLLVPEKTAGGIEVRDDFHRRGGDRTNVLFDVKEELFFRERGKVRAYFVVLEEKDGFLEAEACGYTLRFGSKKRKAGEVVKVEIEGGKLARIAAFSLGNIPLKWELLGGKGEKKIVVVGGHEVPTVIKKALGIVPRVKIISASCGGWTRYYVYFGSHGRSYLLREEILARHHLSVGDTLEALQLGDKLCSLVDRRSKKPAYIPFILNWKWDGERFVLDHTTSCDVAAERLTGCRVLEQTETSPKKSGDRLMAGRIDKIIIGYVPWQREPAPLSVIVVDGKEILFFRDSARFSSRDWEVARLIANPKPGDPVRALAKAEEAKRLEKAAKNNILEVAKLEQAYDAYIDAFCLDSSNRSYLEAAKELRSFIIVRERHLARRPLYLNWLTENLNSSQSEDEQLRLLSDFLVGADHNPTSAAYVLEILAGLAEGNYPGDAKLFRKVFLLLPRLIDFNGQLAHRLLIALRILFGDLNLAYITRWVFGHPVPGREAIFTTRRKKLLIKLAEFFELNWERQRSRKILPFRSQRMIARETWERVSSNLGLVNFAARSYRGRGLDFDDLVREGYFGLLNAAEHYKPERGVKFSTYAVVCIRRTIHEAIKSKAWLIRSPIPLSVFSLSAPLYDDDNDRRKRIDAIADPLSPDPEESAATKLDGERIGALVGRLPPTMRFVVENRFGLNGNGGRIASYGQIGQLMTPEVSAYTVRNLEKRALEILGSWAGAGNI